MVHKYMKNIYMKIMLCIILFILQQQYQQIFQNNYNFYPIHFHQMTLYKLKVSNIYIPDVMKQYILV